MFSPALSSSSGHANKDPAPNIVDMFRQFDRRYFWSKLDNMVEVSWSSERVTSCAGDCSFGPRAGHCHIRLNEPLLSLRPIELIETLLHEMIHAYLFVTKGYKYRSYHGPDFHNHMNRINQEGGTNISLFHTLSLQEHVWRCDGPCQKLTPFFGFVRRANNRAPGPINDNSWWYSHQRRCYGEFKKIQEPAGYKDMRKKEATKPAHPTASSKTGNGSTTIPKTGTGPSASSISYPPSRVRIFSRETSDKGSGTAVVPTNNQNSYILLSGTGSGSYQSDKSASIFTTSESKQHSSTSDTTSPKVKVSTAPTTTASTGGISKSYPAKKKQVTTERKQETAKRKPENEKMKMAKKMKIEMKMDMEIETYGENPCSLQ